MKSLKIIMQHDAMQCGIASLAMICTYYGRETSIEELSKICFATSEGVSLKGLCDAAKKIGFITVPGKVTIDSLCDENLPCILHWNQNHFVVLYKVKGNVFFIADPSKGMRKCSLEEIQKHWIGTTYKDQDKGIALFLEPTVSFQNKEKKKKAGLQSLDFMYRYIKQYRIYFTQIIIGLLLGSSLQLVLPFLTQSIVDIGIKNNDISFIWLILLRELMIVLGRTGTDFIRRWLLLHISMRINISLVSDFFIKLLKLPMSFFDTKLMGDLLQRINDHLRIQSFLTNQVLSIVFSFLSFIVFGLVLFIYDKLIFCIFLIGSIIYGLWIGKFLNQRKVLDYELFEQQAKNQNKTYQLLTSMQEIKLQDCERRRRWEWEDTQADLFGVQMKSLKLQQTQEAGSIFINEIKNVILTVLAATAVINEQMTLGAMLAVQYIIGQLNSPVEQFMSLIYSLQDVKISLERINEIHEGKNEETNEHQSKSFASEKSIVIDNIDFKYDPHALKKTLDGISFNIPEGKVTAIVGASGSGKTTLMKGAYYNLVKNQLELGK